MQIISKRITIFWTRKRRYNKPVGTKWIYFMQLQLVKSVALYSPTNKFYIVSLEKTTAWINAIKISFLRQTDLFTFLTWEISFGVHSGTYDH